MGRTIEHDRWRASVLHWRKQYPDPKLVKGSYSPVGVKATPLRCAKCHTTEHVTRHHKGHEYLFACVMPEWYAARYVRFDPSDWVPLCTKPCHARIHELYAPIIDEVKQYINSCIKEVKYSVEDVNCERPIFVWAHKPDRRVLESFRKRLIAKCDWWLRRKRRKTRRGKYKDHR